MGDRELSDEEALELIRREPSIIRRPIFEIDGEVVVGVDQQRLDRLLG